MALGQGEDIGDESHNFGQKNDANMSSRSLPFNEEALHIV